MSSLKNFPPPWNSSLPPLCSSFLSPSPPVSIVPFVLSPISHAVSCSFPSPVSLSLYSLPPSFSSMSSPFNLTGSPLSEEGRISNPFLDSFGIATSPLFQDSLICSCLLWLCLLSCFPSLSDLFEPKCWNPSPLIMSVSRALKASPTQESILFMP